ncbi:MAG: UDP-N-acetylmuramate--L-alanine ligase, partial [Pseudomonadota bacterium]
ELFILDVYAAGEAPIVNADSRSLCRSIRLRGTVEPVHLESLISAPAILANHVQPNDIVIVQGAGNVSALVEAIVEIVDPH